MYFNIALKNIKKNIKDYSIYFLTLTLSICIFYSFNSLDSQSVISKMESSGVKSIKSMLYEISYVSVLISIILGCVTLYANNFLIKRRNKEFAIYMTLGMGGFELSKILILETFLIGAAALASGLFLGIMSSQFLSTFVLNLFKVDIEKYSFIISSSAILKSVIYFLIIFFIVMIFNIFIIFKFNIIDLLNIDKKNENIKIDKPLVYILVFGLCILSFVILYEFFVDKTVDVDGTKFLIIIILGVIGTLSFFYGCARIILYVARKNEKLYYKNINIFIINQLKSKIRTNFISMSFIAILTYIAIVTLATGISLYISMEKSIGQIAPYDASKNYYFYGKADNEEARKNVEINNDLGEDYRVLNKYSVLKNDSEYIRSSDYINVDYKYDVDVMFIKKSEYNENRKFKNENTIELEDDEVYISSGESFTEDMINEFIKNNNTIKLKDKDYKIKKHKIEMESLITDYMSDNTFTIIVNDEFFINEKLRVTSFNINYPEDRKDECEKKYSSITSIENMLNDRAGDSQVFTRKEIGRFYAFLTGTMVVVSIYVGIILLVTSMAILAIKQLSDADESLHRYKTLKNLYVSEKMINKAIFKQIFIYFMFPVGFATLNSIVGIKVSINTAVIYNVSDVTESALITMFVLFLVYVLYFVVTYLVYKNIIKNKLFIDTAILN